jgi:hypothetical protein
MAASTTIPKTVLSELMIVLLDDAETKAGESYAKCQTVATSSYAFFRARNGRCGKKLERGGLYIHPKLV